MRLFYLDGTEMQEDKIDFERYKLTHISEHDVDRDWESFIHEAADKFYLNSKCAAIAIISIRSLVESFFTEKGLKYKMIQYFVETEIIFETQNHIFYYLKIYNKPFTQEPSLLINILNNPHKKEIADKLSCRIINFPKEIESSFTETHFFTLKEVGKIDT